MCCQITLDHRGSGSYCDQIPVKSDHIVKKAVRERKPLSRHNPAALMLNTSSNTIVKAHGTGTDILIKTQINITAGSA